MDIDVEGPVHTAGMSSCSILSGDIIRIMLLELVDLIIMGDQTLVTKVVVKALLVSIFNRRFDFL